MREPIRGRLKPGQRVRIGRYRVRLLWPLDGIPGGWKIDRRVYDLAYWNRDEMFKP